MDMLVEIPESKWPELRDLFKGEWPNGAAAYCALDTLITYPGLVKVANFRVYCPKGELSNGMVAIADGIISPELHIHPINDIAPIEEALRNSNIIDWKKYMYVASADPKVVECIYKLQDILGYKVTFDYVAHKYLLDNKPLYDLSVPPDTYVAPLKPEHLSLVDQTWKYHSETSPQFFEMLMNNNRSYVLYSSENDNPMCWVSVGLQGALVHLYTAEDYRRLGYAELITKYVANELRRNGRTVVAYTVESNIQSQKMFDKLGFDLIGYDRWVFINGKS